MLGVLFVLTDRQDQLLPLWIALLNLFRELTVTAVRHTISTPSKAVGADWSGKTKLILQVVVIESAYVVMLFESLGRPISWGQPFVFWVAVVMTAVSYFSLAVFLRYNAAQLKAHFAAGGPPPEDAG